MRDRRLDLLSRIVLATAWLCASPLGLLAQDSRPASVAGSRADRVAEIATRAMDEQQLVGLSIAWIEGSKLASSRSFGFADRERQIAASAKTLYRWASISKPVTAIAAMQLVEKHALDLERDVREYVPEFPEQKWPITSLQLLTHQGGIVHYSNGKVVARTREHAGEHPFADVVNAIDAFCDSPLVCEPGTKHSYTTHGYMLLGAVVQRAGKEPFWQQVKARIAEPLAMKTFQPDYQWVAIEGRAVGYRKSASGAVERSTDTDVSWKLPGGGFISSIEDLARFGAGLLAGMLVSDETRARMWTAQPTKDGKPTTYGLGFGVGRERVAHSGGQEKTSTLLVLVPKQKRGIAIMCNTEGAKLEALATALLVR